MHSETTKIPQNTEAEHALLSNLMLEDSSGRFDDVAQILDEKDFYDYKHQIIFRCMHAIVQAGNRIDEITLSEELKKQGSFDDVGGYAGMLSITGHIGIVQHKVCAETIREKSRMRALIRSFRLSVESLQDEKKDSTQVCSEVENLILSIDDKNLDDRDVKGALLDIKNDIDQMLNGEYVPNVIKTHIGHLDDKLSEGGIGMGEVMVLAAPTSCGKTQLALNIVTRSMLNDSKPCMVFSLEMPKKQIVKRMLHSLSGVNPRRIRERRVSAEERIKLDKSMKQFEEMKLYTSHSVRGVDDLIVQARTMKRKHDIQVIVVDYLQLVPWDGNKFSKTEAVSDISHKIKQMAIELNVAVILLSQVNRDGARSEGLQLYHLRDSGDIENDADIIIMMWPDGMSMDIATRLDNKGEYKQMIYNIAKNREGERDLRGVFQFYNNMGRFY